MSLPHQPPTEPGKPAPVKGQRAARWAVRLALAYLIVVTLVAGLLWWTSDDWWPATLVLFGPRWVVALPLVVLGPQAVYARSVRAAGLILVSVAVVAGPFCGGRVRMPELSGHPSEAFTLRVMTWNSDGLPLDHPAFRDYFDAENLDVVVLQEARTVNELSLPSGWVSVSGQASTAVLSRYPMRNDGRLTENDLGMQGGAERVILDTPVGPVRLVNFHLPTPRSGLEAIMARHSGGIQEMGDVTERRRVASGVARHWVGTANDGLIVCGDFNMPVESGIYQGDWSRFGNAFSSAGNGWGTTKQTRWFGTRIDHILYASPWRCREVSVGPAMGSDHRPVLATLVHVPR